MKAHRLEVGNSHLGSLGSGLCCQDREKPELWALGCLGSEAAAVVRTGQSAQGLFVFTVLKSQFFNPKLELWGGEQVS